MQPRANSGQPDGSEIPFGALKEEVQRAQRKLAYFEHFGTRMEQPITETVRRVVDRELDYERNLHHLQNEIGQLRDQLNDLNRQFSEQTTESQRQNAGARKEAAMIISAASEHATRIVQEAIARLEAQLATDRLAADSASVGPSGHIFGTVLPPSTSAPVGAVATGPTRSATEPNEPTASAARELEDLAAGTAAPDHAAEPDNAALPSAFATAAGPTPEPAAFPSRTGTQTSTGAEATDNERIGDRTASASAQALSMPEGLDVRLESITRLKVHVEALGGVDRLVHTLESRLGAGSVAVANLGPGGSELLVTHQQESSLLGLLLTMDSLEFRPIARSEGFLEIEVRSV